MANSSLVSVKEQDFLDQDPPLRGQNFVCLSFVSPEDVIKKKDTFFFERFLQFFSGEMTEFFANLSEKYKEDADILRGIKERYVYLFDTNRVEDEYNYFVSKNNSDMEKEYYEKNNFQTTIRGIKVRGTFESQKEAEIRAQVLKKLDDRFHVFVAEVGCWCPWSPNPEDITQQEYAETQLNTLMKGYKDNQEKKDQFFQERKRDVQSFKPPVSETADDPWIQRVTETPSDEVTVETPSEEAPSTEAPVETPVDAPVETPVA